MDLDAWLVRRFPARRVTFSRVGATLAVVVGCCVLASVSIVTPSQATDALPYAWGERTLTATKVRLPGEIAGQDVVSASLGREQACAVSHTGDVSCWGVAAADPQSKASRIVGLGPAAGHSAVGVAVGDRHACVTTDAGEVYCWGRNYHGQLGDSSTDDAESPTRVAGPLIGRTATSVGAGGFHTCALTVDGGLWCWGRNNAGQLGDGTTKSTASPVEVSPIATDVVFTSVAVGFQHTCATASDGAAYCWGLNDHGQLGDGTTDSVATPTRVAWPADAPAPASVSAGKWHTCAASADGRVWCWGRNDSGQLGNGSFDDSATPVGVGGVLSGVTIAAVSAGTRHTCVAGENSLAYCWGDNAVGQLGDGTTAGSDVPVLARTAVSEKDFTPVTAVAAGGGATVALIAQGSRPGAPLKPRLEGTTLRWQPPRISGVGSGSLSQFRISYLAPGEAKAKIFATVPATETSIDLAAPCPDDAVCPLKGGSLTQGQDYTFTIAGVAQSGTAGSNSLAVPAVWPGPAVSAPIVPAEFPPDMPSVSGLFGTSLEWSPPFSTGSTGVGQYTIRIRPIGATKYDEYAAVPGSLTRLDLSGPCPVGGVCPKKGGDLQPGVTYEVWVYAVGGDGSQSKPPRGASPYAFTWPG